MKLRLVIVAAMLAGVVGLGMYGPSLAEDPQRKDVVDTAIGAGQFDTLVKAVKTAGLTETLKGKGPFTIFAPTDEAFSKIPKEKLDELMRDKRALTSVLTYHVVPGTVMSAEAMKLESAKTVQGNTLNLASRNGKLTVNGANVIKADIMCGNGVIHVIDAVLMPPNNNK